MNIFAEEEGLPIFEISSWEKDKEVVCDQLLPVSTNRS